MKTYDEMIGEMVNKEFYIWSSQPVVTSIAST